MNGKRADADAVSGFCGRKLSPTSSVNWDQVRTHGRWRLRGWNGAKWAPDRI